MKSLCFNDAALGNDWSGTNKELELDICGALNQQLQ